MDLSAYRQYAPRQQARAGDAILAQAPLAFSVDKVGCFVRHAIPGALEYLRDLTGEPVTPKEIKLDNGYVVGWTFEITRPHKVLREVSDWIVRTKASANELHIAGDYIIPNLAARGAANKFLRAHAWVKKGAEVQRLQGYGTLYSDDFTERGKTARNFGLYLKGDDRLRLEVRLYKPRTLRRYVRTVAEILDCAPGDIFANELRLRFVKPSTLARWVKQQEALHGKSRYGWATGMWTSYMQHAPREWLKKHTEIKPFTLGYHGDWQ